MVTVQLDSTKGVPEAEVIFGQAQLGTYKCYLWDASGSNPTLVAHGNNVDGLPDKFSLGLAASSLSQRYLSFELFMQVLAEDPGQLYSVTILIRQDGNAVPGGMIQDSGQFTGNGKSLVEYVRFQ